MFEDIVTSVTLQLALYFNTMFSILVSTMRAAPMWKKSWGGNDAYFMALAVGATRGCSATMRSVLVGAIRRSALPLHPPMGAPLKLISHFYCSAAAASPPPPSFPSQPPLSVGISSSYTVILL